tara:strand:+ start:207 stop:791 length:585 start_codon:yes stop_codon:yes gene_type:complete
MMELYKFGIKFYFKPDIELQVRDYIPEFHRWIQNDAVKDHLLIDVVDYSHIPDGPGIMLIAHEGQFSFDMEYGLPGFMYQRRTEIKGGFHQRLTSVFSTTVHAVKRLQENYPDNSMKLITNKFRFYSNDRLAAENSDSQQQFYKESVCTFIQRGFQDTRLKIENFSSTLERLAFDVSAQQDYNFLTSREEGKHE